MDQEQFSELMHQVQKLSQLIQHLGVQQTVLSFAVEQLIRTSPTKPAIAAGLRACVQEELDALADQPHQDHEAALTLALAAFLEAAGEPPKR